MSAHRLKVKNKKNRKIVNCEGVQFMMIKREIVHVVIILQKLYKCKSSSSYGIWLDHYIKYMKLASNITKRQQNQPRIVGAIGSSTAIICLSEVKTMH